jgi:hypothetical protein
MLSIRHIDIMLSNSGRRKSRPLERSGIMNAKHDESKEISTLLGSCHCGAVRFQVLADPREPASRCNCSVCTKVAMTGRIVKPSDFTLLAGEESLGSYEWGAKISTRFFCRHCGIHCFGRGHLAEVGGDFVSVNFNCIDGLDPSALEIVHWDGRHDNWEAGPRSTPWPIAASACA